MTTFNLTENETRAALVLVKSCLDGMGGKRPSDLEYDEYTWVSAKELMEAGWNKNEAAGTFGALMEKGMVVEHDRNEWALTTEGWRFLDTIWDNKETTEMTCVTIDIANLAVKFHADVEAASAHADKHDQLLVGKPADLEALSGPQMVAVYNHLCDELNRRGGLSLEHTKRFSGKEAGVKRIMANLADLWELEREAAKAAPAPKKAKAAPAGGSPAPRRGTGINLAPLAKVYPCREGSKQATLVDMLSREQGATMEELLAALSGGSKPWQEITVKSGLNWDMNKVKGYGIRTTKRGEVDCYHLVLPAGMSAPLPHTPRKGA